MSFDEVVTRTQAALWVDQDEKTHYRTAEIKNIIARFFETVFEALYEGFDVALTSYIGRFKAIKRRPKTIKIPTRPDENVFVPERTKIAFRVAKKIDMIFNPQLYGEEADAGEETDG